MKKLILMAIAALAILAQAATVQATGFKKNTSGWRTPNYWAGKLSAENGNLMLTATEYKNSGKFWARAMGGRLRARHELPGRHYRITALVKGSGDFYPGFLVYYKTPAGKVKYDYTKPEKPFQLTGKFTRCSFLLKLDTTVATAITPYVQLDGKNSTAAIRNIRIDQDEPANVTMTDVSGMTVIRKGDKAPAKQFKFTTADATVQTIQFPADAVEKAVIQPEISNDKGIVTVPVKGDVTGLYKVVAAADGAAVTSCVLAMDPAKYDELDAIAKKVKADKPLAILYLGDSLNDFDRTYNSVDQLGYFLNKYNPGKFKIYNYSVAGDYITRINDRFAGTRKDGRFKGIFDRNYDMVIISLGNNDNRAVSNTNYEKPLVAVKDVRPDYEKAIATIRAKNSDIPVWILSSSWSDYDAQVKKSLARTSKGQLGIRFGIAKHLDNYNNEVKNLAATGKNIRYIDICTPMKAAFDSKNYADGVHLSLQGHALFAKLLLQAFAESK